jgi:hypothetical protein
MVEESTTMQAEVKKSRKGAAARFRYRDESSAMSILPKRFILRRD